MQWVLLGKKVKSTHLLRRARTKEFHEGHGGGRLGTNFPLFSKRREGIRPLLLPRLLARLQLILLFFCVCSYRLTSLLSVSVLVWLPSLHFRRSFFFPPIDDLLPVCFHRTQIDWRLMQWLPPRASSIDDDAEALRELYRHQKLEDGRPSGEEWFIKVGWKTFPKEGGRQRIFSWRGTGWSLA